MVDVIKEIIGVDFWLDMILEEVKVIAVEKKVFVEKYYIEVGYIINVFFEEFVEEILIQLIFVYGYLVVVFLFVKKNFEDECFIDCFEFFIMIKEYGNVFIELNDLID